MKYQHYTLKEIEQQPALWKETYSIIKAKKSEINVFLNDVLNSDSEIILSGAGSSFFIAEIVAPVFQANTGISTKAISSTEIVTHPELFINPNKNTLMISFARSGNSPESVASVELANEISPNIAHLIISCNSEGKLANLSFNHKKLALLMPDAANDKSLAMTSSVSTMALTALLVSKIEDIDDIENQIQIMAEYAQYIIDNYKQKLEEVAKLNIQRAVFLGSGPNIGTARESHLKLQELTDGDLICKFDSFLGFRHGPKAVVDNNTLIVYLFSNNSYAHHYEKDLVESINEGSKPFYTIGVSENTKSTFNINLSIKLNENFTLLKEEYLAICNLIPAQLLGYYKSIQLGLNPDSPSKSGAIHRVVQGVIIYPYNKLKLENELN